MARYIDAEIIDFSPLKDDFDRARAKVIVMGQPTADVAPRSEVEELITLNSQLEATIFGQREEIKKLEKALRKSLPSYCQVISEEKAIELGKEYGRRELAREIFKDINFEIHQLMFVPDEQYGYRIKEALGALEKKYTEGSDE